MKFLVTSSYPGAVTTYHSKWHLLVRVSVPCKAAHHSVCASQQQLPVLPRARDGDGLGVLHPHHSLSDHLVRDLVRDEPLDTTVSLGKRYVQCGIVRFLSATTFSRK